MNTWIARMKSTIQILLGQVHRHRFAKFVMVAVLCIVSYFFFSRVVVTAVEVRGSSMSPTLVSGDMVLLNRFVTITRVPLRGELVVLKDPETGELVVKRIIGLPEEMIQMALDQPYVNGQILAEPYVFHPRKALVGGLGRRVLVPKGHFYVLGDNRNNSMDSRAFGTVPRENIVGVINL
ncbi:MAG TPA: signal peptidase I [Candidatus Acidoferrum sp.]|nr:signal peptidase I [Candidatus Acidoferrum sp.]